MSQADKQILSVGSHYYEARVKWGEGLTFIAESASGYQALMDVNAGDKVPSPMEMVLMKGGRHLPSFLGLFTVLCQPLNQWRHN